MKYIHNYNIFESVSNNKFFKNKEEIENWLVYQNIVFRSGSSKNYTINNDLTVDIDGNINLNYKNLNFIPIQFGVVTGDFSCSYNNLKNLEGSPFHVKGDFFCFRNELIDLKGCPKIINGEFDVCNNNIINLKYFPDLKGNFYFDNNPISIFLDYRNDREDIFTWIEYLNDFNVISGNKIFLEKLKEVLYLLDINNFNFKKLKKYYTIID